MRTDHPGRGDILVVDDTPANVQLLSTILLERGYSVRAACDGAVALEAARRDPPDLVLLDVAMPDMDGFEVCATMKADAALAAVPVMFVTALAGTEEQVKAFAAGCVDYVTKPFRAEEILARIDAHVSLRRVRAALERSNGELERSNARLQDIDRMRRSLLEMIVHDLKNPITAIQLNADMIRDGARLPAPLVAALDDIHTVSSTMNRMVLDVLDVAHADHAGFRPQLGPVDVRALVADILHELRAVASGAAMALAVHIADELPARVCADGDVLRRVIVNLLDNAMKYAPRGTDVVLEAALDGPRVYELRVRDRGPGVPMQHRDRIFLPHARLDRDLETEARTSRGLGLAFCKLAVEAHGGRIWVEDNRPSGSVFVARLPIDPPVHGALRATVMT